ncbi:MAG: DUF4148 domain-containing protein [Pseudomonadota bacterium]
MQSRLVPVALALSLFTTGAAMAQNTFGGADNSDFPGVAVAQGAGKTRAQVQAELVSAQREGTINTDGEGGAFVNDTSAAVTTAKSRDEVRAELIQALRSGEIDHSNGVY